MLFDVIAYKQIHPHYLWVLVFPDRTYSLSIQKVSYLNTLIRVGRNF